LIYEQSPVRALRRERRWALTGDTGTVSATRVIVATNAYTAELFPGVPIAPKRGQVLATQPVDRVIVPFPMYANRGYLYWRQTDGGRLVVGGARDMDLQGEVGIEERLHTEIQEVLERLAGRITGQALPSMFRWAGIMGFTPDLLPIVGAVPGSEGLYIAAGFSGHGVSLALQSGMEVARMALGQAACAPEAFDPARFRLQLGQ
jgi:glycine/D-amino acid oxidase-like deaminating enzyme